MSRPGLDPVPDTIDQNSVVWRRRLIGNINALVGRANAIDDLTLDANAGSTTLIHPMLTYYSHVAFMPMTANAAAEIGAGTLYVAQATMKNGECVISHANNAQTDRTYRIKIDG